jgi:hypothetical protein
MYHYLYLIRKEEEKSLHRIKIAVSRAIPISDSRQKSFHICNSCFWCATYHMINNRTENYRSGAAIYSQCPVCNKKQIESIPIFGNEIDRHEYSPKANINHKEE